MGIPHHFNSALEFSRAVTLTNEQQADGTVGEAFDDLLHKRTA